MNDDTARACWEERHRGREAGGAPEPFVLEVLPLLARSGIALDIAAGRGRHSIAMAERGFTVIAIDYSQEAMRTLRNVVHEQRSSVWPVRENLDNFAVRTESVDVIVNVNYLDRGLFPKFMQALRPGGSLLVDTFLIDQAEIGHPRDPRFLLKHYELRELVAKFEIVRYREGLTVYPDQSRAWRASTLATRKEFL